MKTGWGLPVVFLYCTACSSVWQEPREITPQTYDVSVWRIERSVGRLRRLGLAPPKFSENFYILTSEFWAEENEKRLKELETGIEERLLATAKNQLTREKGYDVEVLEAGERTLRGELGFSKEEYQQSLELLANWAKDSADGAEPPEGIAIRVKRIGEALNLDGLVVIQGFHRHPNVTTSLMFIPFYGVFAIPLLPLEARSQIDAGIYEISSGRIVWRSRIRGVGLDRLLERAGELFSELENAMPAVLIEEH